MERQLKTDTVFVQEVGCSLQSLWAELLAGRQGDFKDSHFKVRYEAFCALLPFASTGWKTQGPVFDQYAAINMFSNAHALATKHAYVTKKTDPKERALSLSLDTVATYRGRTNTLNDMTHPDIYPANREIL